MGGDGLWEPRGSGHTSGPRLAHYAFAVSHLIGITIALIVHRNGVVFPGWVIIVIQRERL